MKSIRRSTRWSMVAVATLFFLTEDAARPEALACTIEGGKKLADGSYEVTNLQPVRITVDAVPPPSGDRATASGDSPASRLSVEVLVTSNGAPMRSRVAATGQDRQAGRLREWVELEIPEVAAERKKAIENYLARVEADARQRRDAKDLAVLQGGRDAALAAFDRLYFQNRIGTFQLICRGRWSGGGGTVDAPPIAVRVRFDGNFFDQPAFTK